MQIIKFTFFQLFFIAQTIQQESQQEAIQPKSSFLFQLFNYHKILSNYNKNSLKQEQKSFGFDENYKNEPQINHQWKLKDNQYHLKHTRFARLKKTPSKEEEQKKNATEVDLDDESNGLSKQLRSLLKQFKKEGTKPFLPLHSVDGMNFNDKENLKSQSCTTILQEDLDKIQVKNNMQLTQEQLDLENKALEAATQIDLTDLFCKDIFNTITNRIESEKEARDSKRDELKKKFEDLSEQTKKQIDLLEQNLSAKSNQLETEVATQQKEIERQRQLQLQEQAERERNFRVTMKKLDSEKNIQEKRLKMQKRHEDSVTLGKTRQDYIDRVTKQTEDMQAQYQLLLKEQPLLNSIKVQLSTVSSDNKHINEDMQGIDIQITKTELNFKKDKKLTTTLNKGFIYSRQNTCQFASSCEQCTSLVECGYCGEERKCVQGDAFGPLDPVCSVYEYSFCSSSRCVESRTCDQCLMNSRCYWCQSNQICILYANDFISHVNNNLCPFGALNVQAFNGEATALQIKQICSYQ